ncbi:MAG: hypothetical protein IVW54_16590 [Candidatus Binataceae bacterium]|nr:hypothetical protein [Candidatus Binataceae bacterium]
MPLRPEVRRERRAALAKTRPPKKLRRRRCLNDGVLFPMTRKNRRFCKRECKDEYHRYGSAFGPLRDWLQKRIDQASKANFDQKFLAMLKTGEGRAAMVTAGFVHVDTFAAIASEFVYEHFGQNTGSEISGQLEQVIRNYAHLAGRVTAIEARRAGRKKAAA